MYALSLTLCSIIRGDNPPLYKYTYLVLMDVVFVRTPSNTLLNLDGDAPPSRLFGSSHACRRHVSNVFNVIAVSYRSGPEPV